MVQVVLHSYRELRKKFKKQQYYSQGGSNVTVVLTKSSMPIVKWVAEILGLLMNGIFYVISAIGMPNVGLAIIIFTVILLMAMMPMQIKQQRFSKLNTIMQPELNRIRNKYKGKNDQVTQQKIVDETNAVYAKYGVSPMGSCVQLLIQMPVLFALYQVIYKIPGYITIIGNKIAGIAADSGFVTKAAVYSGYGNCVMLDHGNGYLTLYGHLSSFAVSEGESVSQGQTIGYVGSTGISTGPHCHFEVRQNGEPVSPYGYL